MVAFKKYKGDVAMTKLQWYLALSNACIHNPFAPPRIREIPDAPGHGQPVCGSQAKCFMCKKRTNWKCPCGRPVSGFTTRATVGGGPKPQPRSCSREHVRMANAWHPTHIEV